MSPSSCIRVANFSGYEKVANTYGISAAVCVHADAELVITSGHVGMDEDMNMKSDLREQMEFAFKNAEQLIRALKPGATTEEIWRAVYQVSSYHAGGVGREVTEILTSVAQMYMGDHRPAWAAVGVESLAAGKFEMSVSAAFASGGSKCSV